MPPRTRQSTVSRKARGQPKARGQRTPTLLDLPEDVLAVVLRASTSSVRRHAGSRSRSPQHTVRAAQSTRPPPPQSTRPPLPLFYTANPIRWCSFPHSNYRLLQLGTVCKRFQGALQSPEALRGINLRAGWRSREGGLARARSLRAWLASGYGARLNGLSLWIQDGKEDGESKQRQLALAVKGCLAPCTQLRRLHLGAPWDWDCAAHPFHLPTCLTALCLDGCAARVRCPLEPEAGRGHGAAAAAWQP